MPRTTTLEQLAPGGRLAVLCNPASGRVRRNAERVREAAKKAAGGAYLEATGPDELAEATRSLAGSGVPLCVIGGDGTLQAVLTELEASVPHADWPVLSVITGGSTNMSAKDLGVTGSMLRQLEALNRFGAGGQGQLVRRSVVRVRGSHGETRCGMCFGAGAVGAGIDFFQRRLYHKGIHETHTSSLSIAWVLVSILGGGEKGRDMLQAIDWDADGATGSADDVALCLVSSLDRLLLGSTPYWGSSDEPLHFTVVRRSARPFWRGLPRLARGAPSSGMTERNGWYSRDAREVSLHFTGPYAIDGEVYEADTEAGPVRIDAVEDVTWLVV